jgi:hypothetical protein
VNGRSYTQPVSVVPDPRVPIAASALAAEFRLQQRMVAGLAATYHAVSHIQSVRAAMAIRKTEAANNAAAVQISTALQALDTALAPLAAGPSGLGVAHRDLGRRLNDLLVGDVEPTPSVIAGVEGPCKAIDSALDGLRRLEATSVAEVNVTLSRAGLAVLPAWAPPAAPACGPR